MLPFLAIFFNFFNIAPRILFYKILRVLISLIFWSPLNHGSFLQKTSIVIRHIGKYLLDWSHAHVAKVNFVYSIFSIVM